MANSLSHTHFLGVHYVPSTVKSAGGQPALGSLSIGDTIKVRGCSPEPLLELC